MKRTVFVSAPLSACLLALASTVIWAACSGGNTDAANGANSGAINAPQPKGNGTGDNTTPLISDADIPQGKKTEQGLEFTVPYERGEGHIRFARQNKLLRVDARVRLPYYAGDGGRDHGSTFNLSLSVNGLSGMHLIYYPNAVWIPNQQELTPFRLEATYDRDKGFTRRAEQPSFAGSFDTAHWAEWSVTLFIDMRRILVPGNTPDSPADEWVWGMIAGNHSATTVFPSKMDMHNPGKTASSMARIKLSELPELEEEDENPRDAQIETETEMYKAMGDIRSRLMAGDWAAAFSLTKKALGTYPRFLWPSYLLYAFSMTAAQRNLPDIDRDYNMFLKSCLDACPGQSNLQIQYFDALVGENKMEEARKHFAKIEESPLCTERAETLGFMRVKWAESLINWGFIKDADAALAKVRDEKIVAESANLRVNLRLADARLAERKGDSETAVKIYTDLIAKERTSISAQQLQDIQDQAQWQRGAVEQWKEELKLIEADKSKKNPRLVLETDKGRIVIELFEDDAPNTVKSMVSLAQKGFYDGLNFHRVEPSFVAQGGCPKGDGTGSPGYLLKREISKRNHFRGTVAMARSQLPDSAGSQFYICVANSRSVLSLSGQYATIGRVVEGMEIADMLRVGDKIKSMKAENLRDHDYKPETLPDRPGD